MSKESIRKILESLFSSSKTLNSEEVLREAGKKLAKQGTSAVSMLLQPGHAFAVSPAIDGRDVEDLRYTLLRRISENDPEPIVSVLEASKSQGHVYGLVAALGVKNPKLNERIFSALCRATSNPFSFIRAAAVRSLLATQDPRVVPVIGKMLRDRSSDVRHVVFEVIVERSEFWREEFSPELRRFVENHRFACQMPGLRDLAMTALQKIEQHYGRLVDGGYTFAHECIERSSPRRWRNIPGIRSMELIDCRGLTHAFMKEVCAIPTLERLSIGWKYAGRFSRESVQGNSKLLEPLSKTMIKELELHSGWADANGVFPKIVKVKTLERLSLSSLAVNDADCKLLSLLPCLKSLALHSRELTDGGLSHLSQIRTLESLSLRGAKLTGAGIRHLARLKHLRELSLRDLRIGDDDLQHLGKLTALEVLDLDSSSAGDKALQWIASLKTLINLRLSFTRVEDEAAAQLASLKQLQVLDLTATSVTDKSIGKLSKLTRLTRLSVLNTRISAEGKRRPKGLIPGAKVT